MYASRGYFSTRRNQLLDQIAALQKVPLRNDLTIDARFRGVHAIRLSIPTDRPLKGSTDSIDLRLLK